MHQAAIARGKLGVRAEQWEYEADEDDELGVSYTGLLWAQEEERA